MRGTTRRIGRARALSLGVLSIALLAVSAGCSKPASTNGDQAKLLAAAQADLARWDQIVASAGSKGVVIPVGEQTLMVGDDWGPNIDGGQAKLALMANDFETTVALPSETPPPGQIIWPDGSTQTAQLLSGAQTLAAIKSGGGQPCPDCVPLRISGATLTTGPMHTSRGLAQVPVWKFSLADTSVAMTHPALANLLVVPPPPVDENNAPRAISIESARGQPDGRELTVTFVGRSGSAQEACGADYTAEAIESSRAIVIIVTEHPHTGIPVACTALGASRTAVATLAAPLGDRTVLEVTQGMPIEVTPG